MVDVALITGASRGLGAELARFLAQQGVSLVITARGKKALVQMANSLTATGADIRAIAGDVANLAHRRALVDAAGDLGGLDLLVNNASELGPSPLPNLVDYPLEALVRVLDVNLVAPWDWFRPRCLFSAA